MNSREIDKIIAGFSQNSRYTILYAAAKDGTPGMNKKGVSRQFKKFLNILLLSQFELIADRTYFEA